MRVSTYAIGAPLEGRSHYLLLHGLTGAMDKVPAEVGKFIVENRGAPCDPGSEPLASLGSDGVAHLLARGHLTRKEPGEERELLLRIATTLHEEDLANSPTAFVIMPTYTCNLRCPYCFQGHDMHAGSGGFAKALSRENVDHIFAIVDKVSRPGALAARLNLSTRSVEPDASQRPSNITLFGGEPLSRASLDIVPYILAQANARGRALSAITNGVELDAFEACLGPGKIEDLQITLDGLAELHDKRRIGPGFRQTFDRIVANIGLALSRGVRISVRLNIDTTNIADLEELDRFFERKGWKDDPHFMAYAAAVVSERGNKAPVVTQSQLVHMTVVLKDRSGSAITSYENWAAETVAKCMDGTGYPFRRVAHCAAESGMLIFDPLGGVYACWEEVGEPQHRIATYDRHGLRLIERTATQWLTRFPGSIEQCSECPYALIHTSGCASHARKMSGTIFASACESFQEYFPMTLGRAYLRFEERLYSPEIAPHL